MKNIKKPQLVWIILVENVQKKRKLFSPHFFSLYNDYNGWDLGACGAIIHVQKTRRDTNEYVMLI